MESDLFIPYHRIDNMVVLHSRMDCDKEKENERINVVGHVSIRLMGRAAFGPLAAAAGH